jgi:hypothetical protein
MSAFAAKELYLTVAYLLRVLLPEEYSELYQFFEAVSLIASLIFQYFYYFRSIKEELILFMFIRYVNSSDYSHLSLI